MSLTLTEVRVKLVQDPSAGADRLQAFCSITLDDAFVVRDLRIILGARGQFVAMPSRKLLDRCKSCGTKNHMRSRFCNQCGSRHDEDRVVRDENGRQKLHADIAHPINVASRKAIQDAVLAAYEAEVELAKDPGYACRYDDPDHEIDAPPAPAPLAGRMALAGRG